MSARLQREARFDSIILRLRKAGELSRVADRLRIPISTVEQWDCPPRPSAEIQLEVLAMNETEHSHDSQGA